MSEYRETSCTERGVSYVSPRKEKVVYPIQGCPTGIRPTENAEADRISE
jgi:hypothetical protein